MTLSESMIKRIRCDRRSEYEGGTPESAIIELEEYLGGKLPESYKRFLRDFDGGRFCFGRVHRITESGAGVFDFRQELEQALNADDEGAFKRANLIPFADDFGGNYYCFRREALGQADCKVYQWDYEEYEEDERERYRHASFEEYLQYSYERESWFSTSIQLFVAVNEAVLSDSLLEGLEHLTLEGERMAPYIQRFFKEGDSLFRIDTASLSTTGVLYESGDDPDKLFAQSSEDAATLKAELEILLQRLVKKCTCVELLSYSDEEMNSLDEYAFGLGTISVAGESYSLRAGDCHKIVDNDGKVVKLFS